MLSKKELPKINGRLGLLPLWFSLLSLIAAGNAAIGAFGAPENSEINPPAHTARATVGGYTLRLETRNSAYLVGQDLKLTAQLTRQAPPTPTPTPTPAPSPTPTPEVFSPLGAFTGGREVPIVGTFLRLSSNNEQALAFESLEQLTNSEGKVEFRARAVKEGEVTLTIQTGTGKKAPEVALSVSLELKIADLTKVPPPESVELGQETGFVGLRVEDLSSMEDIVSTFDLRKPGVGFTFFTHGPFPAEVIVPDGYEVFSRIQMTVRCDGVEHHFYFKQTQTKNKFAAQDKYHWAKEAPCLEPEGGGVEVEFTPLLSGEPPVDPPRKAIVRPVEPIDPYGVVADAKTGQVVVGAVVSLYELQPDGHWQLWDGKKYQEGNPQKTDVYGQFSFLTPPGEYYLLVNHPDYQPYKSPVLKVVNVVIRHNVQLQPKIFLSRLTLGLGTALLVALLGVFLWLRRRKPRAPAGEQRFVAPSPPDVGAGGFGHVELLVAVVVLAVAGLGVRLWLGSLGQKESVLPPTDKTVNWRTFEGGGREFEKVVRKLPGGQKAEYGTVSGPFTKERIQELDRAVRNFSADRGRFTDRQVSNQNLPARTSLVRFAYAQDVLGALPIEPTGSEYAKRLRAALQERKILWTQEEMRRLRKIKIVESLPGNGLGMYDYARIFDADNNFVDWIGIIYIKAYTGNEMTLAHEYGHHFTNFWAARRTQGKWGNWPADEAGDYYQLRPLPESCHCPDYGCPYYQRDWEILAEDFRETVTDFASQHMFANATCPENGGTLGEPDQAKVAAYLRALPLDLASLSPTPIFYEPLQSGPDF